MALVTLDTNILPAADLVVLARAAGHECAVASPTRRESYAMSLEAESRALPYVRELMVWGTSAFGDAVFAPARRSPALLEILRVVSNGSFPQDWEGLTPGQRRQLDDALILEAHVRAERDIFVSNDERAFVRHGRREVLEQELTTRIMCRREFENLCVVQIAP